MAQFDHLSDMASHWAYPDSPISFNQHSATTRVDSVPSSKHEFVPSIKQEYEDEAMTPFCSSTTARKRALMGEARHRTTALQHAQWSSPRSNARTTQVKRERKPRAARGNVGNNDLDGENSNDSDEDHDDDDDDDCNFAVDSIEPKSTFKCPVAGCKAKPYRRNEHMKRHMKSVHGKALYPCSWCKHVANRMDNLEAHIKLHTLVRPKSGGKPRVDYYPGAVLQYEEMMKKNESRRRRSKKLKKRPTSFGV
ncbi:hypothetical protein NEMBOFW57_010193 [Staphylotrichum longicolle]|uniref:C2H2-type domain-containing protein n=1 Tax=Staphylotrichum longicolle TaxID=669026 RepID=A0AAD4EQQ6_9PEZI|nr:hypothetical protein NEMBOFW57_010193 [Staphylotrichum longicolle]